MERLFNWVTSHHKLVLIISAVVLMSAAAFIPTLTKDTRFDAFLPEDDEVLLYRNQLKETFGLKDPMVIAIVNENGIFNKQSLELVHEISEKLKSVPGVDPDQIRSLSTENNIVGTEEGIKVDPFFEFEELTDKKAQEVKAAIADFELYKGSLVSKDYTTTLVVAEMLDSYDRKQHEVYDNITELLEKYKGNEEQLY
ncbi:MAG: hypothetical protein JKY30_02090, partial [Flavobacteriales bacterium]|nr:hypothetical protein [Flavobacteriales bacterium]